MKKNITLLVLLITLISTLSYGQESQRNSYSDKFIKDCIIEVFQDQADALVFNSTSRRLAVITEFFKSNVSIEYRPEYKGKGFKLISSLGLNNKYNSSLQMDTHYDSSIFNPLKYQFPMNPRTKEMYRIDNTDYIISIYPSK